MPNAKKRNTSSTKFAYRTSYCSLCCRQFQSKSSGVAFKLRRLHEQRCRVVPDADTIKRREELYRQFLRHTQNLALTHINGPRTQGDR